MNKLVKYIEVKSQVEQLSREIQELENDEALKKLLQFRTELDALMKRFDMSKEDVLKLWGKEGAKSKGNDKRRGQRPLKVYKNPHTNEIVKTKGGNQRDLNAWREQYGKEEVDSWLQ